MDNFDLKSLVKNLKSKTSKLNEQSKSMSDAHTNVSSRKESEDKIKSGLATLLNKTNKKTVDSDKDNKVKPTNNVTPEPILSEAFKEESVEKESSVDANYEDFDESFIDAGSEFDEDMIEEEIESSVVPDIKPEELEEAERKALEEESRESEESDEEREYKKLSKELGDDSLARRLARINDYDFDEYATIKKVEEPKPKEIKAEDEPKDKPSEIRKDNKESKVLPPSKEEKKEVTQNTEEKTQDEPPIEIIETESSAVPQELPEAIENKEAVANPISAETLEQIEEAQKFIDSILNPGNDEEEKAQEENALTEDNASESQNATEESVVEENKEPSEELVSDNNESQISTTDEVQAEEVNQETESSETAEDTLSPEEILNIDTTGMTQDEVLDAVENKEIEETLEANKKVMSAINELAAERIAQEDRETLVNNTPEDLEATINSIMGDGKPIDLSYENVEEDKEEPREANALEMIAQVDDSDFSPIPSNIVDRSDVNFKEMQTAFDGFSGVSQSETPYLQVYTGFDNNSPINQVQNAYQMPNTYPNNMGYASAMNYPNNTIGGTYNQINNYEGVVNNQGQIMEGNRDNTYYNANNFANNQFGQPSGNPFENYVVPKEIEEAEKLSQNNNPYAGNGYTQNPYARESYEYTPSAPNMMPNGNPMPNRTFLQEETGYGNSYSGYSASANRMGATNMPYGYYGYTPTIENDVRMGANQNNPYVESAKVNTYEPMQPSENKTVEERLNAEPKEEKKYVKPIFNIETVYEEPKVVEEKPAGVISEATSVFADNSTPIQSYTPPVVEDKTPDVLYNDEPSKYNFADNNDSIKESVKKYETNVDYDSARIADAKTFDSFEEYAKSARPDMLGSGVDKYNISNDRMGAPVVDNYISTHTENPYVHSYINNEYKPMPSETLFRREDVINEYNRMQANENATMQNDRLAQNNIDSYENRYTNNNDYMSSRESIIRPEVNTSNTFNQKQSAEVQDYTSTVKTAETYNNYMPSLSNASENFSEQMDAMPSTPSALESSVSDLFGFKNEPVMPNTYGEKEFGAVEKTYTNSVNTVTTNIQEPVVETNGTEEDNKGGAFYLSTEHTEKVKSKKPRKRTEVKSKEEKSLGDIIIDTQINNATPSSEVPVMSKVETKSEETQDNDVRVIHTVHGQEYDLIDKKVEEDKIAEGLKILFVASECQPFAASGGLGDVAGSLPKALSARGVDIRVILPLYKDVKEIYRESFEFLGNFTVTLSWRQEYCGIFKLRKDNVTYYFVDNERYFKRDNLYGYFDDGERFAFFSKAVVECLALIKFFPNIVHCNDWQTALVPVYLKTGRWDNDNYYKMKTIYTIHNVEYQGVFGLETLSDLFGIDPRYTHDLEYSGNINLTKAAIQFCDKLTTVSHSYCDNLKQPYCSRGLNYIICRNEYKLSGILNGIDYDFYNPATDKVIYQNYDIKTIDNKVKNKKGFQEELGLPVDPDTPMLAIVSRLVSHKGLDLIMKIMEEIVYAQDVQLVVVGTGDDRFKNYFKYLEGKYPTKVRALVDRFSVDYARKNYAASDIFLMPSKIEPCGLSQLIASAYGSVPIVRECGGLKDTIKDFGCPDGGNGYTFTQYNADDLKYQLKRAIEDYRHKSQWRKKVETVMSMDFSWDKSAKDYVNLYKSTLM